MEKRDHFLVSLSLSLSICCILFFKLDKTEDEEPPSTSANPVLELELTEEKLPMTLSRQEVGQPIRAHEGYSYTVLVFLNE